MSNEAKQKRRVKQKRKEQRVHKNALRRKA